MAKAKKTKKIEQPLEVFILVDRSYSMLNKWAQTLWSVNDYAKTLYEGGAKANVTVAVFDQNTTAVGLTTSTMFSGGSFNTYNTFDVVRDRVPVEEFAPLTVQEVRPRGGTPLYDATGKIADIALSYGAEKTVLVIVTDGAENASREYTLTTIKSKLEEVNSRGWEVVFLGAEFNSDRTAVSLGYDVSKSIVSSKENMRAVMQGMAYNTMAYAYTGSEMKFTHEDKVLASGGKQY